MTWVLFAVLLFVLLLLLLLLLRQRGLARQLEAPKGQESSFLMLQQGLEALREQVRANLEGNAHLLQKQLGDLNQQLNDRLKDSSHLMSKTQKDVSERLDNASKVVGDLQGKLGKLEESNARLFEVGKDIRSLQEILKTPKLRGSLGEYLLADLLAQILPKENFELQYGFKNNEKVDAVVQVGEKLVSVDAKFPLENFQRFLSSQDEAEKRQFRKVFVSDVRKHIDAIANKYIRPAEGTYDFALMYVPAENVYYEIIIKDEATEGEHALAARAMKKRVIPVSPNTLYVYLSTIVMGLKGLRIEKAAQEILAGLSRLGNDLGKIQEAFRKTGVHLHNARSAYEDAEGRLGKFGDRMEKLHGPQEEVVGEALNTGEEEKVRALPSSNP